MNLGQINSKVSQLTKADTTSYPTADRLIDLNIWNQNIVTNILQSQDSSDFNDANWTGYSTLSADLVANQRDYNFLISDGVVEVKRVDVTYDGEHSYKSQPIDSQEVEVGLIDDATTIDTYFSTAAPAHDWKGNSLFLYPLPTASVGKVVAEVSRTAKDFLESDLTTGTKVPGFDQNLHMALAYGMTHEYAVANGMADLAAQMMGKINSTMDLLKKQYGNKEKNYPLRFESDYVDYR